MNAAVEELIVDLNVLSDASYRIGPKLVAGIWDIVGEERTKDIEEEIAERIMELQEEFEFKYGECGPAALLLLATTATAVIPTGTIKNLEEWFNEEGNE